MISSCSETASSKREPAGRDRDAAQADSSVDATTREPDEPRSEPDSSAGEAPRDAAAVDSGKADAGQPTDASRPTDAGQPTDASRLTDDCPTVDLTYAGFADEFFATSCRSCHSASSSGSARAGAPEALNFDSEAEITSVRDRIRTAAVVQQRMPPGTKLSNCSIERLAGYLDSLSDPACSPECTNKQCGDNGCGGSCGTCTEGLSCDAQGGCVCVPDCAGKQCGDNGCGGSCGPCAAGSICDTRTNMCQSSCTPDCTGRQCGDDGCGGLCNTCPSGQTCSTAGQCECTPNCAGRQCGDNGCGGICNTCPSGQTCNTAGQCECTPNCAGRQCGDNGCGGICNTCPSGQICSAAGACSTPAIDFARDVYPILTAAGCGSGNCHGGGAPARGLDLSSASAALANLVGVAADECGERLRVAPGAPDSSYLVNKLTGSDMCSGERMPRGGAALPAAQIQTIRDWITGLTP